MEASDFTEPLKPRQYSLNDIKQSPRFQIQCKTDLKTTSVIYKLSHQEGNLFFYIIW